jgi:hypothetical protein
MASQPLFEASKMTLDEKVTYLKRLLYAKCETWNLTIGIFKSVRGPEDHTAHGCVRSKKGENKVISMPSDDFSEAVSHIIQVLETL